ncbi:glutaminyl-peptide cyclotransferase [Streptomyces sp. NBC_01190]|uniref:glutaminyl-peptide cyclotransferase n=1 Tax=Streptomyces sp. NBC_01190 TaxID=2903767 RepID=UPI0038698FDF|nr:glutaminyl-peptide cyclotransferase [Streptomyces sp. NBC_01190]
MKNAAPRKPSEHEPLSEPADRVAQYSCRVLRELPHDPEAFTQGLVIAGGRLIEGTGLYGGSELRTISRDTGASIERGRLPRDFFGEGIAERGGFLYQLTWRERQGFVYRSDTFEEVGRFDYATEGWGLTCYQGDLVMSDGSSELYTLDPEGSPRQTPLCAVTHEGAPVTGINDIEAVGDRIYANVWKSELVFEIDPATGAVTATVDLSGLLPFPSGRVNADAVLNGIAYDRANRSFWVTGKLWPKMFETRFEDRR